MNSEPDDDEDTTRYFPTPLGILTSALERSLKARYGDCHDDVQLALDALELHMRRHYAKKDGAAAIVLEDDKLVFRTVYAEE